MHISTYRTFLPTNNLKILIIPIYLKISNLVVGFLCAGVRIKSTIVKCIRG